MKRIFVVLLMIVLISSGKLYGQKSWDLVKEETGIKVYTKIQSGSDYKAFKAEMQVNCTIDDIVEVLKNTNSINNWVVNCKEVKLLETVDNEQYYYIETALPWPFENRDMIYHFQYITISSQQVKVVVTGIPDYFEPKKGIVRMAKTNGYWLLTSVSLKKTDVTYQMHVEPGGLIPAWLANPFIVDVPLSTFKELRNIVQKAR